MSEREGREIAGWVLQGNARHVDLVDYLENRDFIYMSGPGSRFRKAFELGDPCIIWRGGAGAGVLAVGTLSELPTSRDKILQHSALGPFGTDPKLDSPTDYLIGVTLTRKLLTPETGFVSRKEFEADAILSKASIVTSKQGRVFKLTQAQLAAAMALIDGRAGACQR